MPFDSLRVAEPHSETVFTQAKLHTRKLPGNFRGGYGGGFIVGDGTLVKDCIAAANQWTAFRR